MKFRNPTNGHVEEKSLPALWCFLFGAFYFLVSGIWVHALVMFIITILLYAGLGAPATVLVIAMNIIYCVVAGEIVEGYYLRKGWIKVADGVAPNSKTPASETRKCPFCAEEIKAEAIKCKHCGSDVSPLSAEVESA